MDSGSGQEKNYIEALGDGVKGGGLYALSLLRERLGNEHSRVECIADWYDENKDEWTPGGPEQVDIAEQFSIMCHAYSKALELIDELRSEVSDTW